MSESENRFVVVMESGNLGDLAVAETVLGGEGIPFWRTEEAMQSFFPVNGASMVRTKIQVPAEHAERALELLAELNNEEEYE